MEWWAEHANEQGEARRMALLVEDISSSQIITI
jgi:hypothetical protein